MATYDDYYGVWATVQQLHLDRVAAGLLEDVEIVVIDNNPTGTHGAATQSITTSVGHSQYAGADDIQGTSAPRNKVVEVAKGKWVCCLDAHVLLAPGVLEKLVAFARSSDSADLHHGLCLYDWMVDADGKSAAIGSHWRAAWGDDGMYGKWELDARCPLKRPTEYTGSEAPLEIPLSAMGLFLTRRETWLGFHAEQRGFGGEEGTIHHKYRANGLTTFCLPWLQWVHRWGRPTGIPYKGMEWVTRARNYLLSTRDFGWPPLAELRANFVTLDPITQQQRVSEADWQTLLTEMSLSELPVAKSFDVNDLGANCPHRGHELIQVPCELCGMRDQLATIFHCTKHRGECTPRRYQDIKAGVVLTRACNACPDCPPVG